MSIMLALLISLTHCHIKYLCATLLPCHVHVDHIAVTSRTCGPHCCYVTYMCTTLLLRHVPVHHIAVTSRTCAPHCCYITYLWTTLLLRHVPVHHIAVMHVGHSTQQLLGVSRCDRELQRTKPLDDGGQGATGDELREDAHHTVLKAGTQVPVKQKSRYVTAALVTGRCGHA